MKNVIAYFIRYPIAADLLVVLTCIFGWMSLGKMQSTFFPQTPSRVITISVVYPGASPEEIEEGVTLKIEDNLKGVTGIDRVSSVSNENAATITVEVLRQYDTYKVFQDVKNAVDRIASFPAAMEPPVVSIKENLNFAIAFALTGPDDLRVLKKAAERVEDDLRAVKGISKIQITGYPEEEIEIRVRENDLRAYQMTFREVSAAVRRANFDATGGTVKGRDEELLIRARGKKYRAAEMRDYVVKAGADGRIVRLRDVADVQDVWSDNPAQNYFNGKRAAVVTLQNTDMEDLLFITRYIKQYIEDFNAVHTEVKAELVRDFSVTLRQRIDVLVNNGGTGALLVLLFLSLFLQFRLAFWVALGIPVSFLGMFILAPNVGVTINVISLFGMIIVVGILVDDGIVIAENIYRHYEEGKPPLQAALDGTNEVIGSVTFGVLTTVTAFSTFLFLEGRLGDFIGDMAKVVVITLLISLVEAAFILPAHMAHSRALRRREQTRFERATTGAMDGLRDRLYSPALEFCLRYKAITFAVPAAMFFVALGAINGGWVKTTFFPNIERDEITVTLEMPAGTPENLTLERVNYIERAAQAANLDLKEGQAEKKDVIIAYQKRIGPGSHQATLDLTLLNAEERGYTSYKIADAVREKTGRVEGAEKLTFGMQTPFGKPVSIALMGYDLAELDAAKNELKAELAKIKALKDVTDNNQAGQREILLSLKDKAYLLGLTLDEVVGQVRQGFFGDEIQRLQRGADEVKVWVRYDRDDRSGREKLEAMRIRLPDGREFPLAEIANFEITRGVLAINHLDGKREIRVDADVADPNESVTDIIADIKNRIVPPILARHRSVSVSFEGQSRSNEENNRSFAAVGPVVLIVFVTLIVLAFKSFWQAGLIVLELPLVIIGVTFGHWLHGLPISILSFYGVMALIGVMVNDSIVFIERYNQLLQSGMRVMEAVREAAHSRFRAIVLTTGTTVAGLYPLILERSFQAQFLVPMAVSVVYGLLFSTFITLLLLPGEILLFNRIRVWLAWLWTGTKPEPEAVEPAVKEMQNEI